MYELITIATFTYPTEFAVIKGRLEFEGIECFVVDEMTVQVHNFYSNAIGGIKLQVKKEDVPMALEILKEAGYKFDLDSNPLEYLEKIDRFTGKIPFLNKVNLGVRLVVIVTMFVAFLLTGFYISQLPTQRERLVDRTWCVSHINYRGTDYAVNSYSFKYSGFCDESIEFRENGRVVLPGFNTFRILADWQLYDDYISITSVDTFEHVYNGYYKVDLSKGKMTLTSENTIIYCYNLYQ